MSNYIPGRQLCKKFKIQPIELLGLISNTGLQPRTITGEPIPPPDVEKIKSMMMSIDLDAPFPASCGNLDMQPTECLNEVERIRGNLHSWRGFNFDACVGGLIFFEDERSEILNRLASGDVLFLDADVKESSKAPKKGKRSLPSYTLHNQEVRPKCRKFAYGMWLKERNRGLSDSEMASVDDMVDLIANEGIAKKPKGKTYRVDTIKEWIGGVKTGTKDPSFTP